MLLKTYQSDVKFVVGAKFYFETVINQNSNKLKRIKNTILIDSFSWHIA